MNFNIVSTLSTINEEIIVNGKLIIGETCRIIMDLLNNLIINCITTKIKKIKIKCKTIMTKVRICAVYN